MSCRHEGVYATRSEHQLEEINKRKQLIVLTLEILVAQTPLQIYVALMITIRNRLDVIESLRNLNGNDFSRAETAAFHGRKIIAGIVFACLVAIEKGLRHVPRDARGQWNAETILKSLKSKNIPTLPSPSMIRNASSSESETDGVNVVIEGVPERRISHDDLIAIYQSMHRWLHEINPYTEPDRSAFYAKHGQSLWDDLVRINRFIEKHFISISGEASFACCVTMWTDQRR
jgi:hypothetical protein